MHLRLKSLRRAPRAALLMAYPLMLSACGDSPTTPAAPRIEIAAPAEIRQGDVVSLSAVFVDGTGQTRQPEGTIEWEIPPSQGAVDAEGRLVAYLPGAVRVIARAEGVADTVAISVTARGLAGEFDIMGLGAVQDRFTSDLWIHGRHAYTGTWGCREDLCGDRLYAWDVSNSAVPVRTDSVAVDARTVNDVKISSDGLLGVLTHEGSADGENGITLLDLSEAGHPRVITRYTQGLESGVHNVWVEGRHIYAAADPPQPGLRIIDASAPGDPQEIARFYGGASTLHDVYVRDGLAFLSHWDAGLIILDVGHGLHGGSPANPVEIARIELPGGNVHNAWYWPEAGYVFVGQEVFGGEAEVGRLFVVDLRTLTAPRLVADFHLPGDPPHNFWLDEAAGVLYAAWYSNGLRAIDVTGELMGDLGQQGREYAFIRPEGPMGRARVWAPQLHEGRVFASDLNNGLWVLRFRTVVSP